MTVQFQHSLQTLGSSVGVEHHLNASRDVIALCHASLKLDTIRNLMTGHSFLALEEALNGSK
jgi:hypothetical protein